MTPGYTRNTYIYEAAYGVGALEAPVADLVGYPGRGDGDTEMKISAERQKESPVDWPSIAAESPLSRPLLYNRDKKYPPGAVERKSSDGSVWG